MHFPKCTEVNIDAVFFSALARLYHILNVLFIAHLHFLQARVPMYATGNNLS